MAGTIDFIQIYYKDDQLPELYDFATPYKNYELTYYFENRVIADLVPYLSSDNIAVCSWKLKRKRGESSTPIVLRGHIELTRDNIRNADYDIAVLTPRSATHKPLQMASHWHGPVWDRAIRLLGKEFIKVPEECSRAIYENHFIARKEIYHEYVEKCLKPCIDYMDMNKEVFLQSADYLKRKRDDSEREHAVKQLQRLDLQDYPIAPFILERLFSIWIEGKKFNVINL